MLKCYLFLAFILLNNAAFTQEKKLIRKGGNTFQTISKNNPGKYPSLLWEISGNGLKKPSYLFGTMHISQKLAFHLGDSFYHALKSAETVALETNPEFWQDDISKSTALTNPSSAIYDEAQKNPKMNILTFAIGKYEEALKAALMVEPSMINSFLYRSYGSNSGDFEENTYLDLHIFQTGKKLGKRLTGVEDFEQSEQLLVEAYKGYYNDKNKKKKSYDYESAMTATTKLEEAYRRGDLDMLDSIQSATTTSEAFNEKFLLQRNDIQANSIDTILKKSTLFVAVGAAHLPGKRGVVNLLRSKGYTVRPVQMDDRNSLQKDAIDQIRQGVKFQNQTSEDGVFNVSIPGKKFYRFTNWAGMDVVQNADMVNGAYYMVTRVKTDAAWWNVEGSGVNEKLDSLFYENIPGKIIKKTNIVRSGYNGWDITNRTRRGDVQRYNIFVTPFEVLFFKMSGTGDYVSKGTEADQFFSSIRLKEYKQGAEWVKQQPHTGGFSALWPHEPSLLKDQTAGTKRLEYAANDKEGNTYLLIQTSVHHYDYVEADSFDLKLMEESYASSEFIDKRTEKHFLQLNGYPALEASYKHIDGSFSTVRYIIRGPVYYTLATRYKKEASKTKRFFESFTITPFTYPDAKLRKDTALQATLMSPMYEDSVEKASVLADQLKNAMTEESGYDLYYGKSIEKTITNDTTGEKIYVYHYPANEYTYVKDSLKALSGDSEEVRKNFIIRGNKVYRQDGMQIRELSVSDTGSSRMIMEKMMFKNGHYFTLVTETDTLRGPSTFIRTVFETFRPVDTLKAEAWYVKKTNQFLNALFSTDSAVSKKAYKVLEHFSFDSTDFTPLKNALEKLTWGRKNYLEIKKSLIQQVSGMKNPGTVLFLTELYARVKDTSELQNVILNTLLSIKTRESFLAFKNLLLQEPPIGEDREDYVRTVSTSDHSRYSDDHKWEKLYDTLSLARVVFPDLLQLIDIDDYKTAVKDLLTTMVDSGYLHGNDYSMLFSKLYVEAKMSLKKQFAKEAKKNMDQAEKKDEGEYNNKEEGLNSGNDDLEESMTLLMPFYEKNTNVQAFFNQLLTTKDKRLLYKTLMQLVRSDKPYPDSLFRMFAAMDKYRADLYGDLKKLNKLTLFPATYGTQEYITRSLLLSGSSYSINEPDTLVYLQKLPVTYKHKEGYVYFFKYKAMRDDPFWQLAAIGMQPKNEKEVDVENTDFSFNSTRHIDANKSVEAQVEKLLNELENLKHKSASDFYVKERQDMYKSNLTEAVKGSRYRD